jgi:putative ABC transport system substrate-binding protein
LLALAADLAKLNVDVIYASSSDSVAAAQRATKIPIVFEGVAEPVQAGFADSLAHPGRNVTGLTNIVSDLNPKRVQFLKEMTPKLTRLALLVGPETAFSTSFEPSVRAGAEPFGIRALSFGVAEPRELEPAFQSMKQWGADAVVMSAATNLWSERRRIASLALGSKLPSMCPFSDYVEAGALMSYGVDRLLQARKIASYVRNIFQGAKAGDLPIEQPTQIDLVISRKTAKALGLEIPQRLLLQADKVID